METLNCVNQEERDRKANVPEDSHEIEIIDYESLLLIENDLGFHIEME